MWRRSIGDSRGGTFSLLLIARSIVIDICVAIREFRYGRDTSVCPDQRIEPTRIRRTFLAYADADISRVYVYVDICIYMYIYISIREERSYICRQPVWKNLRRAGIFSVAYVFRSL